MIKRDYLNEARQKEITKERKLQERLKGVSYARPPQPKPSVIPPIKKVVEEIKTPASDNSAFLKEIAETIRGSKSEEFKSQVTDITAMARAIAQESVNEKIEEIDNKMEELEFQYSMNETQAENVISDIEDYRKSSSIVAKKNRTALKEKIKPFLDEEFAEVKTIEDVKEILERIYFLIIDIGIR